MLCCFWFCYIDELMQERRDSIDNVLEIRLSYINPFVYQHHFFTQFTHILQDHFTDSRSVIQLARQWSNPEEYDKLDNPNLIRTDNITITKQSTTKLCGWYIDGLMQGRCNSSVLAIELHLSCTNASICSLYYNSFFVVSVTGINFISS